jgi:Domain of unknown function (DUF5753)
VTLQVLPFASGGHGGDVYLEDPDVTRRYAAIFDHLRATALDPAESTRTLATVKSELERS